MTSYIPPLPIWHCPSCAIEWAGRPTDTCWACGGPAQAGPWRNSSGVGLTMNSAMTYKASDDEMGE